MKDPGYISPIMRYDQRSDLLIIQERDPATGVIESQIPTESVVLKCRTLHADAPAAAPGQSTPVTPATPAATQEPSQAIQVTPGHVSVFV